MPVCSAYKCCLCNLKSIIMVKQYEWNNSVCLFVVWVGNATVYYLYAVFLFKPSGLDVLPVPGHSCKWEQKFKVISK